MLKVIVVANEKGGVGKSTIACNLAIAAVKDGLKTLLIDADIQGSSMLFRASREADDLRAISITQPTIHKDIKGFDNYDLVIVDAGAKDNYVLRSAITAASYGILIIPVLASQLDIWATENTFKVLKEARINFDIDAYAVFNQVIVGSTAINEAKDIIEDMRKDYQVEPLQTILYSRMDYKKSISKGLSVIESEPGSKAAAEINWMYDEVKSLIA